MCYIICLCFYIINILVGFVVLIINIEYCYDCWDIEKYKYLEDVFVYFFYRIVFLFGIGKLIILIIFLVIEILKRSFLIF